MTLTPAGRVTLAWAVDEAVVPASTVLLTDVLAPVVGITVTTAAVPTGMFAAVRFTVTGLAWPAGRTMSGASVKEPFGRAGAFTPATEAITRLGPPERLTGLGVARLTEPPPTTPGLNEV